MHKLCETWPPELGSNELVGLEVTRVAGSFVVVAVGEDGATEGVLWRDIDATFVGQDTIIELPV